MNEVQIAVIGVIAAIVLIIIVYYIYQEQKFKKLIEQNFNQATDDALVEEQGLVFDNEANQLPSAFATSKRDQVLPPLDDNVAKEEDTVDFDQALTKREPDADLAQFAAFDQVLFPFNELVQADLDHVIDIAFPKLVKLKLLPELAQFSTKNIYCFVLEKNANWVRFEKGHKYQSTGLKVVINLVDRDGVLSELQVANLYNELAKFAAFHEGSIRQTNSEFKMRQIQQQLKGISKAELELELFMVNKDALNYKQLSQYFANFGLINHGGVYRQLIDGRIIYEIRDAEGATLAEGGSYTLFAIRSKLHQQQDPLATIEHIFDFAEDYVKNFEARLLTSNRLLMTDKDYNTLQRQVTNYINNCKRYGLELGSPLMARVLP